MMRETAAISGMEKRRRFAIVSRRLNAASDQLIIGLPVPTGSILVKSMTKSDFVISVVFPANAEKPIPKSQTTLDVNKERNRIEK